LSATLPELGPNERRLLFTGARVELEPRHRAALRELVREPLDWDALVSFAHLHSVASLIHRHLKDLGDPNPVPAEARGRLLALVHSTAYRNRIFSRESAALAGRFQAAGVRVLIPKGMNVVELIYGDLALRPLIDLLFLLPHEGFEAAEEALSRRGYREVQIRSPHAAYQWACPKRYYFKEDDLPILVLIKAAMIDLPPRRHRFSPDRLWPYARPAVLGGREVLTLAPIDQVLYLCLQADNHGHFNRAALGEIDPADLMLAEWSNNRLVRFTDINETIRRHREELDWDHLVARARSCAVEDAARASLVLTEHVLGAGVPPEALEALSPGPRPRLRRALLGAVAQPGARRSPRGAVTAGWEGLGQRRQKELFRLFGFVEVAFPGVQAFRSEHETWSAPKLLGLSALQAANTISRSVAMFLKAWVQQRGASSRIPWPSSRVGV